jgi:hypothetical protein
MSAHVKTGADVASHAGSAVRATGRYATVDLSPHKMLHELPDGRWVQVSKVVDLVLADGTRIGLQVRPDDEMTRLEGREVHVTGKLLGPQPRSDEPPMASPDPEPVLVDITSIEEA